MASRFNLNLGKYADIYEAKLTKGINEGLDLLKDEIDKRTPEDTKDLLKANEIEKAKTLGTTVVGRVQNETEYGEYVEFGIGGAKFNYNKPKGSIFYKGVGARMYTRGFDDNEQQVKKIIRKNLKIG